MPNPLYTYILDIYDLSCLGFMGINYCRLFNVKSSLCIYIFDIYDLACFGFMAY